MTKIRIIAILLSMCFLVSCGTMIKPESEQEAYLVALTEFNNIVEVYVQNMNAIEDQEVRSEIRKCLFMASTALDGWKIMLETGGDAYEQQVRVKMLTAKAIELIYQILGDE